jgi:chromosome segregation protein
MLKALEIVGFKSFADRTRFEFPRGITVVVGPNGSGKSNVVDSIKWVLGEQSVKSLRGREMTDVIFNGSGSRRAMNTAEITLTFDNSKHLLPVESSEVHITRRVYRSGEGEYLINRNPARLRDIRDLLAGTGMGTQAYSVIEQGKVDSLLQSSARDRRVIFEEAAGISRFKLRKLESLRRLERVDQNLLRLSDIVDEVDSRLRGVRAQAGKARRYKEYADRLQELRTQVGLVDWNRLSQQIDAFDAELQALRDQRDANNAELAGHEAQVLEIDGRIGEIHETIRQAELQISANRERIAAAESTIEHERKRSVDLDEEIDRHRRQMIAMSSLAGDLQQQLHETQAAAQAAESHHNSVVQRLSTAEHNGKEAAAKLEQLHAEHEKCRTSQMQQMRQTAAMGSEINSLQGQVASAADAHQLAENRMAELDGMLEKLQAELDQLRRLRADLTENVERHSKLLGSAKEQILQLQQQRTALSNELGELRQRQSGVIERASVLEELVRRHEGLNAGVKEVLTRAGNTEDPVFREVCGLVADVLHVGVEVAPLVEIALGQTAQHVVVAQSGELLRHLQAESGRLQGRVGFVWLDAKPNEPRQNGSLSREINLEGRPGVLGRADRFVETQLRFVGMVRRLLGRTWFVEKLSHALELARLTNDGLSFVTLSGELLEPDGTLTIGPKNAGDGLISRRSQLRALLAQREELDAAIGKAQEMLAQADAQIAAQQQLMEKRTAEHHQAVEAMADNRVAVSAAEERRSQFDQQRSQLSAELQAATVRHDAAARRLAETLLKRRQIEADQTNMESHLAQLAQQIDGLESQQATCGREITEIKVELAKCAEQLRNLRASVQQFEESRQERDRAIDEADEHMAECVRRGDASRWAILQAESEIADLYLHKETYASAIVERINEREALTEQRNALASEIQKLNGKIRRCEEKIHATDLKATEVRHDRNSLADRMREDYQIELAEIDQSLGDQPQQEREAVQREIDELRQKINNIGNVNLESLEELEQLESRYKTLYDQYHDLVAAKNSLEKIIDKINVDSRQLFTETLDTVRGHFQTLFHDLFGGGSADILLEENVDILESGIEIIARPPGKEPRNISLLSGGEKTMTCVALLLAIFRSRPSPFCVLDEVDAALDEANIDRFTKVLQDFLTWTQFIIITHSKKTMTCANTIYGVTMQESGISKQVSVRFEDVSDDGHILTHSTGSAANKAA